MSKNRTESEEPNYSAVADFTVKKAQNSSVSKQVSEIIRWEKKELSGVIFGSGLLFFYFTTFGGFTYLALASVLLITHILVSVGLNLYHMYSVGPGSPEHESAVRKPWNLEAEQARKFADFATVELNKLSAWYAELLSGRNLVAVAQAVGVLFCTWTVGNWVNGFTLLFLAFLGVFTLPIVYEKKQKEIHNLLAQSKQLVEKQIENVRSRITHVQAAHQPPAVSPGVAPAGGGGGGGGGGASARKI